jgi:hypothetical protein
MMEVKPELIPGMNRYKNCGDCAEWGRDNYVACPYKSTATDTSSLCSLPNKFRLKVKGRCGFMVATKTWRQGHSIKCKKSGSTMIRYWQPDRTRYLFRTHAVSHIEAEVWDFCRICKES